MGQVADLHYNRAGYRMGVYKTQGLEGLLVNQYGGKKSEIEKHAASILSSFQNQSPLIAAEAVVRSREMTGLQRSPQQVRVWMKRIV